MVDFWKLLQAINEEEGGALLDTGEESKAMRVIRTGVGLRSKKECGDFWDDFISICNDSEGLSELLDVPPEKISGWASKVKEAREKMDSADDQGTASKNAKVITTGNEPLATADGMDSTQPADTRPMP
jgi:hypothetical protein